MGRDVRHLHPVDIVVPLNHVVESVFPMHGHQRVAVLIHKKESAVPVDHLFKPWRFPVLNACLDYPVAVGRVVSFHGCESPFVGGFFQAAQAAKGGLGVATPTRFP